MDPARPVHVGQSGADLGEDPLGAGHRRSGAGGGQDVLEAVGGALHHQGDGAVQFGAVGVVDGDHGEGADQVRVVGAAAEAQLTGGHLGQGAALTGAGAGRAEELDGGGGAVRALGGVDTAPGARAEEGSGAVAGQRVAVGDVEERRRGDGPPLGGSAVRGGAAVLGRLHGRWTGRRGGSSERCSSRTRSNLRASATSSSRLPPAGPSSYGSRSRSFVPTR